jgi:hypothetical protein
MRRRRLIPWVAPLLAACAPRLEPMPIPVGLIEVPPEAAIRWADSTRLSVPTDIRFRFRFDDAGGRGRARFTPADSIRFDVAGPLGMGRASVFIVGDSAVWTEPEEQIRKLVPNYPLFWAMLGVARRPMPGSTVRGFSDQRVTAWQFATEGDTVEYVLERGNETRLIAEVRQGGSRLGRVETRFGSDGFPVASRLTVLKPRSRLDLSFQQHTKVASFAPDIWLRPAAAQP